MDYKYIQQLMERYWAAETTLEEEQILRTFFSQKDLPADMQQWQALFCYEAEVAAEQCLGDDFDARMLSMIAGDEAQQPAIVKAREVKLTQRLMPLFKAAAVVAIILTLGGALQAPWDASWSDPRIEYANQLQAADSIAMTASPIQAENVSDAATDSTATLAPILPQGTGEAQQ